MRSGCSRSPRPRCGSCTLDVAAEATRARGRRPAPNACGPFEVEASRSCSGRTTFSGRAQAAVEAHVRAVAVELLRPLGDVVVARPVGIARRVRQRDAAQRIARACGERRLRGMTLPGNWVRWLGSPPSRVEDVDAVRAEVAGAGGRGGHGQQLGSADVVARALVVAEEEPLFFTMGPPIEPPNWSRLVSGRTRPVTGFSTSGCENGLRAWNLSRCRNSKALPWNSFVPDLVCTETTPGDGLAELGVVVLRGDLGLADRLEVRVDDDDAEDRRRGCRCRRAGSRFR